MKTLVLCLFLAGGVFAQSAGMRSVYVFPMAGGLDQYLASWIAKDHVLQVTTDPQSADLVLTDQINDKLAKKLLELHPVEVADADDEEPADKSSGQKGMEFRGGRGKGTIFLVDARSRAVVWSEARKPVDATAVKMNGEAKRIAKSLQGAMAK